MTTRVSSSLSQKPLNNDPDPMTKYVPPRRHGEFLPESEPRFPLGLFWGSTAFALLWSLFLVVDASTEYWVEVAFEVVRAFLRNPLWFPVGVLLGLFILTAIVFTLVWVVTAVLTSPVGLLIGSLLEVADNGLMDPQAPVRGPLYCATGVVTGAVLCFIGVRYTIPIAEIAGGNGAIGLGGTLGGFFGALGGWITGITLGVSYGAARILDEWDYWKPWLVLEAGFDSRLLPLSDEKIERFREEAAVHQSGENNTHQQSPMDGQEKRR